MYIYDPIAVLSPYCLMQSPYCTLPLKPCTRTENPNIVRLDAVCRCSEIRLIIGKTRLLFMPSYNYLCKKMWKRYKSEWIYYMF